MPNNTRKYVPMPPEMVLSKEQANAMKNELNAAAKMPLPNNDMTVNEAAIIPLPNNKNIVRAKKAIKMSVPMKKSSIMGQMRRSAANVVIQRKWAQRNDTIMKHRGIPDKAELLKEVNKVKEEFKKENATNKTPSRNDTLKQQAEEATIRAVTEAIERTDDKQPLERLADIFKTDVAEVTITNDGDPNPINNQAGNSSPVSDPGETVSAALAGAEEAAKELAGNSVDPNPAKNAIAQNNINKAIVNNATTQINAPPTNVANDNSNSDLSDARSLVATIDLDKFMPESDADISSAVKEADAVQGESNIQLATKKAADIAYKAIMKSGGSMDQAIRAAYMAAFKVLIKSGKSLFDITQTATKVVLDIALQAGLKLEDIILSLAEAAGWIFFKIIRSAGVTVDVAVRLTFNLIITLLKIIGAPIAEFTTLAGQVVYDIGIKAGESAKEFISIVATIIAREAYIAAINSGATAKIAGELAFEAVVSVLKQIGYGAALITTVALTAVKDAVIELTRIATNAAISLARAAAEQAYKKAIDAKLGAEAAAAAAFEASVAAIKRMPGITLDIGAIAGNATVYAITNLGKYTAQVATLLAKLAATVAYQVMVASGAVLSEAAKAAANAAIPIAAKASENIKDVIIMAAQAGASAATSVATKAVSSIWSGLKSFVTRKNRSNGEINMAYLPSRYIEPANGSRNASTQAYLRQRRSENIRLVGNAQGHEHEGHARGNEFRGLTEGTHANPREAYPSRNRKQTQLFGNLVRYGGTRRIRRR
jgi:hypothetical protein